MPNFVINKLTISGDKKHTEKVEKFFSDSEGNMEFSFEKFIPVPSDLENAVSGCLTHYIMRYLENPSPSNRKDVIDASTPYLGMAKKDMSFEDIISEYESNLMKFGVTTSHSWKLNKWGCKWDASNSVFSGNDGKYTFYFKTPWTSPFEAILYLSNLLVNCTLYLEYADENLGYNCGCLKLENGLIKEDIKEDSAQFGKELWDEFYSHF